MLRVKYKPFVLSVIMLSVVMLSVVAPNKFTQTSRLTYKYTAKFEVFFKVKHSSLLRQSLNYA